VGLDWCLDRLKPRDGYREEFDHLFAEFTRRPKGDPEMEGIRLRLLEISVEAISELGCPRVGIDQEANDFFRKVYEGTLKEIKELEDSGRPVPVEFKAYWKRSFEEVLTDNYGMHVLELAKERAGLPAIVGMMAGPLDFRGDVVANCTLLNETLRERAYEDHKPEEAVEYAELLTRAILEAAPDDVEVIRVRQAIKWLEFWGSRGYGFRAWY